MATSRGRTSRSATVSTAAPSSAGQATRAARPARTCTTRFWSRGSRSTPAPTSGISSDGGPLRAPMSLRRFCVRALGLGPARDKIEAQRVEHVGALEEVAVAGAGNQLELGARDPRRNLAGEAGRHQDVVL